ncbi:DUF2937 family protein [Yoonia sp. 2307UL14-13]|uniref:DUF2937 family protein n=1 Tax=Yoonia sp. 2307UL14-13 TaxID=3126506 RepID=UPI0030A6954A
MIRALCLIGGLTGAAGLSQFPEFSQQYLQRLAGQAEALTLVVKEFDTTALEAGLGREQALEQMTGTPLLDGRQADMRRVFARHARLSENLTILREASPLQLLVLPHRMADGPTVQDVWADFVPAVPVSTAGVTAAGAGFLGGWLVLAVVLSVITAPIRWMRRTPTKTQKRREPAMRTDPPVARPTLVSDNEPKRPRLAGVQR